MRAIKAVLWTSLFLTFPLAARADDWPQWMGPGRDDVWRAKGILETFPLPLNEAETSRLHASAGVIRQALDELGDNP